MTEFVTSVRMKTGTVYGRPCYFPECTCGWRPSEGSYKRSEAQAAADKHRKDKHDKG